MTVFFTIHDPTTLNRQGNDVGTQYRSAIFYHNEEQKNAAEAVIREIGAAGIWDDPIVTEVIPFDRFYIAEDYHQEYFKKNPFQGYCRAIIAPKVAKFRHEVCREIEEVRFDPAHPSCTCPIAHFPCGRCARLRGCHPGTHGWLFGLAVSLVVPARLARP